MYQKKYLFLLIFSFSFLLVFYFLFFNKDEFNDEEFNNKENNVDISKMIELWNYETVITYYTEKWVDNLDSAEFDQLLHSYLQEWVYKYEENKYSSIVLDLLEDKEDSFNVLYYKWFANEIIKEYELAINFYNKALNLDNLSENEAAILLNQIWHVYDIMWDRKLWYKYYHKSYDIDNNHEASWNIWRYLARNWKYKESIKYFKKSLDTNSNSLKSEIYYSLSSIVLNVNQLNPDIEKSIEYAKESINYNKNYPMWYLWVARWLYMKNDSSLYEEINDYLDKSIDLNPNWYEAYYYKWLVEYNFWDFELAVNYMNKWLSVVDNDIILMDNQRELRKNKIRSTIMFFTVFEVLKKDKETDMNYLFNNMNKYYYWDIFVDNELKRNNYWLFWNVKWVDDYVADLKFNN